MDLLYTAHSTILPSIMDLPLYGYSARMTPLQVLLRCKGGGYVRTTCTSRRTMVVYFGNLGQAILSSTTSPSMIVENMLAVRGTRKRLHLRQRVLLLRHSFCKSVRCTLCVHFMHEAYTISVEPATTRDPQISRIEMTTSILLVMRESINAVIHVHGKCYFLNICEPKLTSRYSKSLFRP